VYTSDDFFHTMAVVMGNIW